MSKRSATSAAGFGEESKKNRTSISGSSSSQKEPELVDIRLEMMASSKATKSSIAKTLQILQQRGMLSDDRLGQKGEARHLGEAVTTHANADTPYGKVVQSIPIETTTNGELSWEIIHPFAFMWYLSTVCVQFGVMMADSIAMAPKNILRLILYGDELTPGNPLRADLGRQAFNFYYSFAEWPSWLLHRKDGWLALGSLRTKIIHNIKGGVTSLVKSIMKLFFIDGYANLQTGFSYEAHGASRVCQASFGGFLADEKGLKEFMDIKGQAGVKPCVSCKNVKNFIHKNQERAADPYVAGLDVCAGEFIDRHTDESFYAMVDMLIEAKRNNMDKKQFEELEKVLGINYNADGLLFCAELRDVYKPVTHYIRDWQHTLASSGVIGSEIYACLSEQQKNNTLKNRDPPITLVTLEEYADNFHVPTERDAVNKNWFKSKFLTKDHVKHFSSDVLCMLPIVYSFLVAVVEPIGVMTANVQSMGLLCKIVSILQMSYDFGDKEHKLLRKAIDDHHKLFRAIYGHCIKVKFHHLFHLPENLLWLKRVVSCFVTERKHRDWKALSLFAFRHVEHQSVIDFCNYAVQEFKSGRFSFLPLYLIDPEDVEINGVGARVSLKATCYAGTVSRGKIVLSIVEGGRVIGMCRRFWEFEGQNSVVEIDAYDTAPGLSGNFSTSDAAKTFVPLSSLRALLIWAPARAGVINIILPSVVV